MGTGTDYEDQGGTPKTTMKMMMEIEVSRNSLQNNNSTWWGLRPLWLNNDFGPPSKDCGPHTVVEGMCCQAKEFIAAVSAQAMDEQCKINSHNGFTQQHVEPWLVLLSGRRQQRNQGRHTCRERTHICTTLYLRHLYTKKTLQTRTKHYICTIQNTFMKHSHDGVISLRLSVSFPEAMKLLL